MRAPASLPRKRPAYPYLSKNRLYRARLDLHRARAGVILALASLVHTPFHARTILLDPFDRGVDVVKLGVRVGGLGLELSVHDGERGVYDGELGLDLTSLASNLCSGLASMVRTPAKL